MGFAADNKYYSISHGQKIDVFIMTEPTAQSWEVGFEVMGYVSRI
jgi:hypothetical protein